MDVPALLPRLLRELGATTIVVTAAVGGVEPGLAGERWSCSPTT
jgi:purine nucleoside phosphorylase